MSASPSWCANRVGGGACRASPLVFSVNAEVYVFTLGFCELLGLILIFYHQTIAHHFPYNSSSVGTACS